VVVRFEKSLCQQNLKKRNSPPSKTGIISGKIIKNGSIHNGKQKYMCRECGRQFVENPANTPVAGEKKELINRPLLEKISLAGIARAVCVSETWLQSYVNGHYQSVRRKISVISKKNRLTIRRDELWPFVQKKKNRQWIWLAPDACTRELVGLCI